MTGHATLAIVVLNWNGADDTLACLTSLKTSVRPVHAVVVDNGSTDTSVARLTAAGVADTILETNDNLGYAGGNNVGIDWALEQQFEYIAVLNNDTISNSNTWSILLDHLGQDPDRALTPDIRYFDDAEVSWFAGGVVDRGWPRHMRSDELSDAAAGHVRATELLSGCAIIASHETWRRVGGFDEGLFLIFEDSDWSMRARRAGIRLEVVPQASLLHKVSASFTNAPTSLLGSYYFTRNGIRFQRRWAPGHLRRFLWLWLLVPSAQVIRRRRSVSDVLFRWLGLILGRTQGRAPRAVEMTARLLS